MITIVAVFITATIGGSILLRIQSVFVHFDHVYKVSKCFFFDDRDTSKMSLNKFGQLCLVQTRSCLHFEMAFVSSTCKMYNNFIAYDIG